MPHYCLDSEVIYHAFIAIAFSLATCNGSGRYLGASFINTARRCHLIVYMRLRPDLLIADAARWADGNSFGATISAHGLYHTQQFVLRLSPLVHRSLMSAEPGIRSNGTEIRFYA
jgi:hypothetical protein